MEESPVINESEDFVPLDLVDAVPDEALEPDASAVHEPEDDFTPMQAPAAPDIAPGVRMPTPDQVVHLSDEDRRLDTVPFEFADIRALAQRILKRAQEQGMAKIEAARKQVDEMEKAAYDKAYKEAFSKAQEEGYAKGEKEGKATAQQQINQAVTAEKTALKNSVAPITTTLKEIGDAFTAAREQLMAQAEGDLLMLALDLAKRLVGHELSVNPEAIKPLAQECIGLVTDRTAITVRVNPEDKQIMEEYCPDLKLVFPDLGPVKVLADASVERGGIMAATREAEVDMRLATRLAAFEEVILGVSGDDAIPPWGHIPEDAIAAAKAANAESPYSLWNSDEEPAGEPPEVLSEEPPEEPPNEPADEPAEEQPEQPPEPELEPPPDEGTAPPDDMDQ